jgi:hypothetical protein
MAGLQDWVRWELVPGTPVRSGDTTVTPIARTLVLRIPHVSSQRASQTAQSFDAAWVWNRPAAVLVERAGYTERIPIVDVTRIALIALGLVSGLFAARLRTTKST